VLVLEYHSESSPKTRPMQSSHLTTFGAVLTRLMGMELADRACIF